MAFYEPLVRVGADGTILGVSRPSSEFIRGQLDFSQTTSVPSTIADEPSGTFITVGGNVTGAIDFTGDTDLYRVQLGCWPDLRFLGEGYRFDAAE